MTLSALKPRAELELDKFALDPYCKLYLPLWKLDGDKFADRSAYGHLCTNYGSIWTPQGRSFDGVDDYVDCGSGASLNPGTGEYTFEFRSKTNEITVNSVGILDKGYSNNYLITKGNAVLRIFLASGSATLTIANYFTVGDWIHTTIVLSSGNIVTAYKNGVFAGTASYSGSLSNSTNLLIGIYDNYFTGLIAEVRIYNRALTPQEILDHYIIGKEMFG